MRLSSSSSRDFDIPRWYLVAALTALLASSVTSVHASGSAHSGTGLQAEATTRPVVKIELFEERGARPAYSIQGDKVAFDRRGADGLYDIYIREGDPAEQSCLTCEARELRHRNNIRATWEPSGEHLIFLGQAKPKRFGIESDDLLTPSRGLRSDLFLFRVDGKNFWQLTRASELESAILDARFSFEAGGLTWSQRASSKGGPSGRWQLMVGRVEIGRGGARIAGIRQHEPPERPSLILAQQFLPDENGVLISANLESGQAESGRDLYELSLEDGSVTRLTHSKSQLDEFAHISPTGSHIVWSSNSGLRPREAPLLPPGRHRDLWIMKRDGREKQRLTFFNGGADEELGEAYVGDFDWHPDGDHLVVHVIYPKDGQIVESLWQLTFEESFRRP